MQCMQDVWTPYISLAIQMLFVTSVKGCPAAAAAFCSVPRSHCTDDCLCSSPRVRALPPPGSPVLSLIQTCFSGGCSRRLRVCRSSPPCAMCHRRPSLRAVLLAKDTLWHSCLPPLLQSGRFVSLCTLLMSSFCRDPAPHRRSK